MSDTDRHEIVARATAHHYHQTTDPDEVPRDDQKRPLSDYGTNVTVAHTGYECTCGDFFIFGHTAAEHLRSVGTGNEQSETAESRTETEQ